MATSGTTSSPTTDWAQFYEQNLSGQALDTQTTSYGEQVTNAMMGTISPTSPCGDTSPSSGNLNPQGRVAKPSRRRSRASRRTPTTLVNTDASNFRAMVQQFTGGPVAPYAAVPQYPRESNINFGFGINQQQGLNATAVHVQHQQQQQRQVHQQQQQRQQQYMFDSNHAGAFLERSYNS